MTGLSAAECALLSVAQMTEADRLSVEAGIAGVTLMQNAGAAVVREVLRRWSARRVAVLCGPGNNGGDGFVVARLLAEAGWPVRVALAGARDRLRGDARSHADHWKGATEPLGLGAIEGADLIIDALFGSGLDRPLAEDVRAVLESVSQRALPVCAVDVPSGVRGDSGESWGAIAATCTVTFTRKKPGHLLLPGRTLCGETVIAEIGTPVRVLERLAVDAWENHPTLWRLQLPHLALDSNKYTRGHALMVGGWPTTGAARMAARAAARVGAGLTTIAVPPEALAVYAGALESIMVRALTPPQDLAPLLEDKRFTGLALGPGAGLNSLTKTRALVMLATGRPTVLDADALTVFAADPTPLFAALSERCVLTPHEGEFARLFARTPLGGATQSTADKLARTREAARLSGAVLVLKGADTVVAAPDGRAVINANAPPWLATAGAGDVLSGMILGLLTQGMEPFWAAAAAVWMHGAAASEFGPGLLAEDLPDLLPGILKRLSVAA